MLRKYPTGNYTITKSLTNDCNAAAKIIYDQLLKQKGFEMLKTSFGPSDTYRIIRNDDCSYRFEQIDRSYFKNVLSSLQFNAVQELSLILQANAEIYAKSQFTYVLTFWNNVLNFAKAFEKELVQTSPTPKYYK